MNARAATDVIHATATENVVSARNAFRDNPARKVRNVDHAVNATSAIGRTRHANSASTRQLKPQRLHLADRSQHRQLKNHGSNSSRKLRLRPGQWSLAKKAKDADAVVVVVVVGVAIARDASHASN